MNYAHAFHAGNYTEVFKHSALVLLLEHLRAKEKPFFVLDTHAGAGVYDLGADEAQRTGEAAEGIGKIYDFEIGTAHRYLEIVRRHNSDHLRYYPGSPKIIQDLLRPHDRLVACDLSDPIVRQLKQFIKPDDRVSVHLRDGYEAIKAFLPPAERRGLVFMDPPFEVVDEFERLAAAVLLATRKWPTGILAAWYPIKRKDRLLELRKALRFVARSCLLAEFSRYKLDDIRLAGSGLIICNPPWGFTDTLRSLGNDLLTAFDASQGRFAIEWLRPPG